MLPKDLIWKKLACCKDDTCEILCISAPESLLSMHFWHRIAETITPCTADLYGKHGDPNARRFSQAESDADLWRHSLTRSEHFNPISSKEITLLLVRCPAAGAKQMSPNGTGINNPFDYCYYFASGPCSFITHPDRKNSQGDSALLKPSEIKSHCIIKDRGLI